MKWEIKILFNLREQHFREQLAIQFHAIGPPCPACLNHEWIFVQSSCFINRHEERKTIIPFLSRFFFFYLFRFIQFSSFQQIIINLKIIKTLLNSKMKKEKKNNQIRIDGTREKKKQTNVHLKETELKKILSY